MLHGKHYGPCKTGSIRCFLSKGSDSRELPNQQIESNRGEDIARVRAHLELHTASKSVVVRRFAITIRPQSEYMILKLKLGNHLKDTIGVQ